MFTVSWASTTSPTTQPLRVYTQCLLQCTHNSYCMLLQISTPNDQSQVCTGKTKALYIGGKGLLQLRMYVRTYHTWLMVLHCGQFDNSKVNGSQLYKQKYATGRVKTRDVSTSKVFVSRGDWTELNSKVVIFPGLFKQNIDSCNSLSCRIAIQYKVTRGIV